MKLAKLIWMCIGFSSLVGIVIGFSVNQGDLQSLNAAGSSGVQPLLSKISDIYTTSDIVTQAGGSTAGINAVLQSTKDIGMSSKNPGIVESYLALTEEEKKDLTSKVVSEYNTWELKQIKSITMAWDGMGIIYKPYNNEELDLTVNNMYDVYEVFAGNEQFSYSKITGDASQTNILRPVARSGGSSVSGTADAFANNSNLEFIEGENWGTISSALKTGNYGQYTQKSAEANSQTWNFVKDKQAGTLTYLSAGYIINNLKAIEAAGFKVATYNGISVEVSNITNGYDWYRPLNLMFSLNDTNTNILNANKQLMYDIFTDPNIINLIADSGYIPLNEAQILTMGLNINSTFEEQNWVSDYEQGYCGAK